MPGRQPPTSLIDELIDSVEGRSMFQLLGSDCFQAYQEDIDTG